VIGALQVFCSSPSPAALALRQLQTVVMPQAFQLIAHSGISRGATIDIAFYALQFSDQFNFGQIANFQSGNRGG
jgi:D-alanyl-D-alanine dipeptidase